MSRKDRSLKRHDPRVIAEEMDGNAPAPTIPTEGGSPEGPAVNSMGAKDAGHGSKDGWEPNARERFHGDVKAPLTGKFGTKSRDQKRMRKNTRKAVAQGGSLSDSRMSQNERAVAEAIENYLTQQAKIGLMGEFEVPDQTHTAAKRIEGIFEEFALKFVDSPFYESVTGAFRKLHSYKYIDHPTFKASLESELKCMGVPMEEIKKAVSTVDSLVEGLSVDNPSERDAGWNTNLGDIQDMTRNASDRKPSSEAPFNTDAKDI